MARMFFAAALIGSLVLAGHSATAEEKGECLQKGDDIGAFYVSKVGGAVGDGVEAGQELCYRCRYGQRPMVMVFARQSSDKLDQLLKQLDQAVENKEEHQLRGLLTLIGDETAKLRERAEKITKSSGVKKVPVSVSLDPEAGPKNYRLDPSAEVVVIVAKESKVVANHSFKADAIDVDAIMKDVDAMLN